MRTPTEGSERGKVMNMKDGSGGEDEEFVLT